jgi:hypothetical protein
MTVRGTINFTRDLSLQIYAQPFMAAVDYSNFKKLIPPKSYEPVGPEVYDEEVEQPDFNWTSLNSNVVLRWEYRPGSALYFVWTQTRDVTEDYGNFVWDREWRNLADSRGVNTFLVKLNYWLSI